MIARKLSFLIELKIKINLFAPNPKKSLLIFFITFRARAKEENQYFMYVSLRLYILN